MHKEGSDRRRPVIDVSDIAGVAVRRMPRSPGGLWIEVG